MSYLGCVAAYTQGWAPTTTFAGLAADSAAVRDLAHPADASRAAVEPRNRRRETLVIAVGWRSSCWDMSSAFLSGKQLRGFTGA